MAGGLLRGLVAAVEINVVGVEVGEGLGPEREQWLDMEVAEVQRFQAQLPSPLEVVHESMMGPQAERSEAFSL